MPAEIAVRAARSSSSPRRALRLPRRGRLGGAVGRAAEHLRGLLGAGPGAEAAGALLLYLVLAWALISPWGVPDRPTVPGDPRSDVWKHMWGMWWFWSSLASGQGFPTETSLLGFPGGGSLYNIDPLNSLLAVPLLWVMSLPTAFSILVVVQLALGAWGGWWLARRLTGDPAASLVAGLGFGFAPFLLCYGVSSGVTETVNLAWVALFLGLLLRLPEGGWKGAAATGAALAFVSFACWYYGMACVVMAGVGFLVHSARAWARGRGPQVLRAWAGYGLLGVVFLAAVAPPGVAFYMTLNDPDSQHPRYVAVRTAETRQQFLSDEFHNAARPLDFFRPGKGAAVVTNNTDRLIRSPYLGWTLLALALLAWRVRRARGLVALGWSVALLFAFLAMGPQIRLGESSLQNPVYLLGFRFVPGFSQVAIPIRFVLFSTLFLGLLAALGLSGLLEGRSPARRRVVVAGAVALMVLELALVSPVPFPIPVSHVPAPAFYRALAATPGNAAVLDLPLEVYERGPLLPGQYFVYQTLHGRPIPYKVSGVIHQRVIDVPLVSYLRARGLGLRLEHDASPEMLREGAQALQALGVGFVSLHGDQLSPRLMEGLRQAMEQAVGPPRVVESDLVVFDLSQAGRSNRSGPPSGQRPPKAAPEPDSDITLDTLIPGVAALSEAGNRVRLSPEQAATVRSDLAVVRAGARAAAAGSPLDAVASAEYRLRKVLTPPQIRYVRANVKPLAPRLLSAEVDRLERNLRD